MKHHESCWWTITSDIGRTEGRTYWSGLSIAVGGSDCRWAAVLVDAQPRLILTLNNLVDGVKSHFTGLGVEPECLTADDIGDETPVAWRRRSTVSETSRYRRVIPTRLASTISGA